MEMELNVKRISTQEYVVDDKHRGEIGEIHMSFVIFVQCVILLSVHVLEGAAAAAALQELWAAS